MLITIYGQTPSQKNAKQVAYNPRTKKPFIMSNKIVKDWQQDALTQLSTVKEKFASKVRVDYMFYVKDNRGRDIDNMIASINDVLQNANTDKQIVRGKVKPIKGTGIIAEDNWQHLEIGSARAELDKENPRAEITITPL